MLRHELAEVRVGDHVAVEHHERLREVPAQRHECAGGAQELALERQPHGHRRGVAGQVVAHLLGVVVDVECHLGHPVAREVLELVVEERATPQRREDLRDLPREREESGAPAGSEQHCLHRRASFFGRHADIVS